MSGPGPAFAEPRSRSRLVLEPLPGSRREWFAAQWSHREVLSIMARSEFHTRYKRASFGVLWAVAVPAVQAAALAVVFSKIVRTGGDFSYAAYAVVGVFAWAFFSQCLSAGATAIVDGSTLADKVWFPRSLLVFVPCLANIPGLGISLALYVLILPVFGVGLALHTLLLIPAIFLLVLFTSALCLVLAAAHVYFRDVRYLVQASLLVLFYLTPILYPQTVVGGLGRWLNLNPLTGIANLFHLAAIGSPDSWSVGLGTSIAVSVGATALLVAVAIEVHRRHDRLFVDLL